MNDWVFCNKCSLKHQSNLKYFLSECGHIFCERCVEKLKQTKKCPVCNKPTVVKELSKDMDYCTQLYFWPLENILQQYLQVFNFQSMHKKMFLQTINRKYSYAKKECIHYYNINRKLQKENQMLRDMLNSAGYKPSPFITSTPAMTSDNSYDNNLSMLSSIRFTPMSSFPGSAQKMFNKEKRGLQGNSVNSSVHRPSPAQMVPKGYPAPVHRDPKPNPAAATLNFLEKLRGKAVYPGNPRK